MVTDTTAKLIAQKRKAIRALKKLIAACKKPPWESGESITEAVDAAEIILMILVASDRD